MVLPETRVRRLLLLVAPNEHQAGSVPQLFGEMLALQTIRVWLLCTSMYVQQYHSGWKHSPRLKFEFNIKRVLHFRPRWYEYLVPGRTRGGACQRRTCLPCFCPLCGICLVSMHAFARGVEMTPWVQPVVGQTQQHNNVYCTLSDDGKDVYRHYCDSKNGT